MIFVDVSVLLNTLSCSVNDEWANRELLNKQTVYLADISLQGSSDNNNTHIKRPH